MHFCGRLSGTPGKETIPFSESHHPKKGCDLLIEAFARVASLDPTIQLVMAGPGEPPEWAEQLKQRTRELGLAERITWTGMLKGHAKWIACAAEVFVLPTHQENFGIAITEALACGTPVLITCRVNICGDPGRPSRPGCCAGT